MYKHIAKEHDDEKDKVYFELKVVDKLTNPMTRQIEEAVQIRNKGPKTILNSKSEDGPAVKRKIIEGKEIKRKIGPGKS